MAARATCSQELSFRDERKLCHECLKRTTADMRGMGGPGGVLVTTTLRRSRTYKLPLSELSADTHEAATKDFAEFIDGC